MSTAAVIQEYQTVNLSQLIESPTNPRKTFEAKALDELAESIKAMGILQPIVARPTAAEGQFEIIAGARRFRAARIAGKEAAPIRVCQMTDAQVLEAQVVENLQRADVHPYEETQGFLALMRLDPAKFTPQEIAARTGKSMTFVVHRLKLADLIPAAAESLQKDEIAIGHALELARLTPKQQEEALPHCFTTDYTEGTLQKRTATVQQFARYIQNNIILELSEAPFSSEDAALYPEAGACADCPKRSGFNQYLFEDVKHDSCFDPECYSQKISRYIATCGLVQIAGDYLPVPEDSPAVPRNRYSVVKAEEPCDFAEKAIVATGHNTGTVMTVCTSHECETHTRHRPASELTDEEDSETLEYNRRNKIEAQVKEQTAEHIRKEISKKVSEVPSESDMELLSFMVAFACEEYAEEFLQRWGIVKEGEDANMTYGETVNFLLDHLATLNSKTRTAVIFDMLLFSYGGLDGHNYRESRTVAKAAELYHINVEAAEKRIRRKVEADHARQEEQPATEPAEAAIQPVEATESAVDAPEATAQAESIPESNKASSRAGKRRAPKAAATPAKKAKTAKKPAKKTAKKTKA
jgi:ParB family chromosome partitioning protein